MLEQLSDYNSIDAIYNISIHIQSIRLRYVCEQQT